MILQMKEKFNQETFELIKLLNKFSKNYGVNIYFVGGLVRDVLLGEKIKDIDIVVEGDAVEFCAKFEEENEDFKIKSVHHDFNTVKMNLKGIEIDFASTREEEYPKSGCLPIVKNIGCPLINDLKRRDFTVNSLAISVKSDENEEPIFDLLDYTGGLDDLKRRKLRVLHDNSFIDDPTRILRALDFELRFKGFKLSKSTEKLKKQYLENPERDGLSISRVELTLKKIFSNKKIASSAYKKIIKGKLYRIFTDSIIAKSDWAKKIEKTVEITGFQNIEEVYLLSFKDEITSIFLNNYKNADFTTNYEIYKHFKNYNDLKFNLYLAITQDNRAKKYLIDLKGAKNLITGDMLLKSGYEEGSKIGEILEKLLEHKLNHNNLETATDELIWVKNNF